MTKLYCFVVVLGSTAALAQTPPCGRAAVGAEGLAVEERFLTASPEHVRFCLIKALPAVSAKVHSEDATTLDAKTDLDMAKSRMQRNKESGAKVKMGAMGTFKAEFKPATEAGREGTRLKIEFHKNAFKGHVGSSSMATPLMEETACLVGILSPADPVQNPRGLGPGSNAGEKRRVILPEGTPLNVLLRESLYSKTAKKRGKDQPIMFEVASDVQIDSAVVIRRGALGAGSFLKTKGAGGYGRSAELQFLVDTVTAADGQTVKVSSTLEKSRGARKSSTAKQVAEVATWRAWGFLDKGVEAVVRAGTSFEVETAGEYTIQVTR